MSSRKRWLAVSIRCESSPFSSARRIATCSHCERLAQPVGGDAEQRLAVGVGEEALGELRQRDQVAALGFEESQALRRESAESRPISRPETRKTKSAATLRGSWIVKV